MSISLPSNPPSNRADLRVNNFDFLRFLKASLVIFSHSYSVLADDADEPLFRATRQVLFLGTVAVFAFFVISGFLVAASWQRSRGLGDYAKKRVLRIYPGFLAATAISYFVVGPIGGVPLRALFAGPVLSPQIRATIFFDSQGNNLAFPTLPYPHAVNVSVWTIKFEVLCYFLLPVLGLVGAFGRHKRFTAVFFLGLLASYVLFSELKVRGIDVDWPVRYLTLAVGPPIALMPYATYFAAGITAFVYRDSIRYSLIGAVIAIAGLVASVLYPDILCLVMPFAFSYLILWLAFDRRVKFSQFGRFGDFSYGIYLYASPSNSFWCWDSARNCIRGRCSSWLGRSP